LAAGFAASTAALLASAAILMLRERAERASVWLLSFAIGTLLGAATLGLLPEALHHASTGRTMPLVLAGMVMIGWLLPLAAGGFVYIALADLVPALHHRRGVGAGFAQVGPVLLGIAVIWTLSGPHH
jgi:zinc transporter ZupT